MISARQKKAQGHAKRAYLHDQLSILGSLGQLSSPKIAEVDRGELQDGEQRAGRGKQSGP